MKKSIYLDELGTKLSNKGANFEVWRGAEVDAAELSFVGENSRWWWWRIGSSGIWF